jgi:hypothetical protein
MLNMEWGVEYTELDENGTYVTVPGVSDDCVRCTVNVAEMLLCCLSILGYKTTALKFVRF